MQDAMREQYLKTLQQRMDRFKLLLQACRDSKATAAREEIRQLAHALHDSGGPFGYPTLSSAAREVEYAEDTELLRRLVVLLKEMKDIVDRRIAPLGTGIDAVLRQHDRPALSLVPKGEELPVPRTRERGLKIDLSDKSVLLAEDDMATAGLIRERLQDEGLSVRHVPNGREALVELGKNPYSLLILDVNMPLIDGFEVLRKVRGELGMPDVPVIMLTAMGSEPDIIRGYDLGANDYILKPFSMVQLIARVKSLLKGTRTGKLV